MLCGERQMVKSDCAWLGMWSAGKLPGCSVVKALAAQVWT